MMMFKLPRKECKKVNNSNKKTKLLIPQISHKMTPNLIKKILYVLTVNTPKGKLLALFQNQMNIPLNPCNIMLTFLLMANNSLDNPALSDFMMFKLAKLFQIMMLPKEALKLKSLEKVFSIPSIKKLCQKLNSARD